MDRETEKAIGPIIEIIKKIVEEKGPIKTLQLIAEIPDKSIPKVLGATMNISDILEYMEECGQVKVVHYAVPSMAYREKCMYFPAGTSLSHN